MKLGNVVGHPPSNLLLEPDSSTWVSPKVLIGVEIEIENPTGRDSKDQIICVPWWEFKQDGSLRDNGFEMLLRDPLFGKDLTVALEAAKTFINNNKGYVFNYRTGLHIHIDLRNAEIPELKRLFILYSLFESAIFNFIGDNRNLNNFCAPWARISDHLEEVFTIFADKQDDETIRHMLRKTERYSALNCNALHKYGSVEFRHMQMSRDFDKLYKWINIIMSLYSASNTNGAYGPAIPVDALIAIATKGGYREMARRIFPEWFGQHITDKVMWEGIFLAQDLLNNTASPLTFNGGLDFGVVCPHTERPNRGYLEFVRKNKEPS